MMTYEKYQFVYNSNEYNDKKLLAYAKSTPLKFVELDISKGDINISHLAEMCERTGAPLHHFVNKHKIDQMETKMDDIENFDSLAKVIKVNPTVLDTPIFILGRDYYKIDDMAGINHLAENFKTAADSEEFQK
ncbi:hypothetical protein [Chondrinema litorale]|uniref:hypothetical protein n=1 Tax=Chondrinema litorale TaxID=2994555 RepID=UPI002543031D|nr:hypothetical protein [Chondrinema litorale]UZR98188.1 hypothetical protein OQ292_29765 [Chondrinema litorale]